MIRTNKKYRYTVTVKTNDFPKIKGIKLYNIIKNNDNITFNTMKISKILDMNLKELDYNDNYHESFINVLKNYTVTLIGIILISLSMIVLSKTIVKIEFIREENYNQEIYEYVEEKLTKYGKFAFLNENINDINKDLRSTFYKYQWIGISKKGTTLLIDIAKTSEKEIEKEDLSPGSLYAKYDAFITGYYISSGKALIKQNISVEKDTELISGTLTLYNNDISLVKASGYVIGNTSEYITKNVAKESIETNRSGKVKIVKIYSLFNKVINNPKIPFESYDVEYKEVYSLKNIFSIKRAYYYEIVTNLNKYDVTEATKFVINSIKKEFNDNKRYDFEKILELKVINKWEDEDNFYYKIYLRESKDITYFKKYE